MTPEQFANFMKEIHGPRPPFIRFGQNAFNKLYEFDPILANKIIGTECDPFYNDAKVSEFINSVVNLVDFGNNVTHLSEKESRPCQSNDQPNTE